MSIEGCKHGPSYLIPQPCEDCERDRVSERARTHAFAEQLSRVARLGGEEKQDAQADPVRVLPTMGDLGAEKGERMSRDIQAGKQIMEQSYDRLKAQKYASVPNVQDDWQALRQIVAEESDSQQERVDDEPAQPVAPEEP